MVGPFTAQQITERLGSHWIPSRRFGLTTKIRAADNFSQYLVNSAISTHAKIDLEGIDNMCAIARFFLGAVRGDGAGSIPGEEEHMEGVLASGWGEFSKPDLVRCLNLKHACKQLVRRPDDAWASALAVFDPSLLTEPYSKKGKQI